MLPDAGSAGLLADLRGQSARAVLGQTDIEARLLQLQQDQFPDVGVVGGHQHCPDVRKYRKIGPPT